MSRFKYVDVPAGLSQCRPPGQTNAIGSFVGLDAHQVIEIALQYGIQHLVHADQPDYETEKKTAEIMLTDLEKFLDSPLSSVISPDRTLAPKRNWN